MFKSKTFDIKQKHLLKR